MIDMPYFMTNEKWYFFDIKQKKFVLTKDAPEKAKKSYEEWEKEKERLKNSK